MKVFIILLLKLRFFTAQVLRRDSEINMDNALYFRSNSNFQEGPYQWSCTTYNQIMSPSCGDDLNDFMAKIHYQAKYDAAMNSLTKNNWEFYNDDDCNGHCLVSYHQKTEIHVTVNENIFTAIKAILISIAVAISCGFIYRLVKKYKNSKNTAY